jgi:hypothetical protein
VLDERRHVHLHVRARLAVKALEALVDNLARVRVDLGVGRMVAFALAHVLERALDETLPLAGSILLSDSIICLKPWAASDREIAPALPASALEKAVQLFAHANLAPLLVPSAFICAAVSSMIFLRALPTLLSIECVSR